MNPQRHTIARMVGHTDQRTRTMPDNKPEKPEFALAAALGLLAVIRETDPQKSAEKAAEVVELSNAALAEIEKKKSKVT